VTVTAEAEQDQVEVRDPVAEKTAEFIFIVLGSFFGGKLTMDSVDISFWDGDGTEESFIRHVVVAVGMAGWDAALIPPEEMDALPVHICSDQPGIHLLRGGTTCQCNREPPLGLECSAHQVDKFFSGSFCQR
jgi:hypothetical protein